MTMSTVGYGDISPASNVELVVCIFTMLFACGVFGFSISQVGTLFNDLTQDENELD